MKTAKLALPALLLAASLAVRGEDLRYVSAHGPVPRAHLECMRAMDAYFHRAHLRFTRMRNPKPDLLQNAYGDLARRAGRDWGISASVDYRQLARKAGEEAQQLRRDLDERRAAEAGFQADIARLARNGSYEIAVAMMQALSAVQDVTLVVEDVLDQRESEARYATCVLAHGLPGR